METQSWGVCKGYFDDGIERQELHVNVLLEAKTKNVVLVESVKKSEGIALSAHLSNRKTTAV